MKGKKSGKSGKKVEKHFWTTFDGKILLDCKSYKEKKMTSNLAQYKKPGKNIDLICTFWMTIDWINDYQWSYPSSCYLTFDFITSGFD